MKKNNLIRFVQSVVLLPMMTMPITFNGIPAVGTLGSVLVKKVNMEANVSLAQNQAIQAAALAKTQMLQREADAIDAYFEARNMPLEGFGMKMALEADNNGIDWRLLPAIAVRESTGGKNACDFASHNPFGWGSCKIGFKSNEEAIETVARNLGGNNPNTANHYENKNTEQILRAYNPPSIVPNYVKQVIAIMNAIGPADVSVPTDATT